MSQKISNKRKKYNVSIVFKSNIKQYFSHNIKMINHIKNLAFIKLIVMIVNKCTLGKILTAIKNIKLQTWKIANLKDQI